MSISHRRYRVTLYSLSSTTDGGFVTKTYTREASTASDGAWWGSLAVPTGRETTLGSQAEHAADAVIGLHADAPVTEDGLVKVDDVLYQVRAVLPRQHGTDEVQVLCERVDDASYTTVES